jgi:hypothetical protein
MIASRTGLLLGALFIGAMILPNYARAHLFGGPPFLFVNGQPAQTNPTYMSVPAFTMPQDMAPGTYLVDQPITFSIDLSKLPVPENIARDSTFRWYWEEDSKNPEVATTVQHRYNKTGSHLVTLEVMAPGETSYLALDTVRVNVIPKDGYNLPKVEVSVVRDAFTTKKPIAFRASSTSDSSTVISSTTWDFGDSTSSKDPHPTHKYSDDDFLHFVFAQVTDKNGLKAESGVTVSANRGDILLSPLMSTAGAVPLVEPDTASSNEMRWIFIGSTLIFALSTIALILYRRRRH